MMSPCPAMPLLSQLFKEPPTDHRRKNCYAVQTGSVYWRQIVRDGIWKAEWTNRERSSSFALTYLPDVGRSRTVRVATDERPLLLDSRAPPGIVLQRVQDAMGAAW